MERKKKSPMEINPHRSPMDIDFDRYAVEVKAGVQARISEIIAPAEPPSEKEDKTSRPRRTTKKRSSLKSAESRIEEPPSKPEDSQPEEPPES